MHIFCLGSLQGVFGKARVTIQLVDYKNTGSKSYDGNCCEVGYRFCPLSCDNWFSICVKKIPMKNFNSCIKTFKTKVIYQDNDNFYFPGYGQDLGDGLTNPLKLTYDGPLVSKNIFINICVLYQQ